VLRGQTCLFPGESVGIGSEAAKCDPPGGVLWGPSGGGAGGGGGGGGIEATTWWMRLSSVGVRILRGRNVAGAEG
jgi:hypothetical protein